MRENQTEGLHDPRAERDACGVGFVVDVKGRRSRTIVERALTVLQNLTHRGACGCDPETGDATRLLRFEAGVETTETIRHDFWEEVWILDGELTDLGTQQTFTAGMYACRPPGMAHGPYRVSRGCTTLELRYGRVRR